MKRLILTIFAAVALCCGSIFAQSDNDQQIMEIVDFGNAEISDEDIIDVAAITDAIRARGLGPNLVELGYLPHEQTVREQRAADILLLPLRQEPEYAKVLPGKIFEYLAACRPVLGIGQEQSAAATVLRDAGAGEMFDWNKTDELLAFLDVEHPQTSDIDKYSRRALTAQLIQILP